MNYNNFEYEVKYGLARITGYTGTEEIVEIPAKIGKYNVYSITSQSFAALENLKKVIIPKTVGMIQEHAFIGCEKLSNIELYLVNEFSDPCMDCAQTIVFETTSVQMGNKIQALGNSNYQISCIKDFKYEITDEEAKECKLVNMKFRTTSAIIPDIIDGYKITEIGFSFYQKKAAIVKKIKLPKYLKSIPDDFLFGRYMDEFIMGSEIESIGTYAFSQASIGTNNELKLPKSVKKISESAFDCFKGNIILDPQTKLEKVEERAFNATCIDLNYVVLPNLSESEFYRSEISNINFEGVTNIPKRCFRNATISTSKNLGKIYSLKEYAIESLTFEEDVTLDLSDLLELKGSSTISYINVNKIILPKNIPLAKRMFSYSKVKEFEFPEDYKFTTIPSSCFSYTNISEIKLPKSIDTLDTEAFAHCRSLTKINLENIKAIKSGALYSTDLTEINLSDDLKELGSYSLGGRLVEEIDLSHTKLTEIPKNCFYFAPKLQKVILPETLYEISRSAFSNCTALTEINLENVKVIKSNAFSSCSLSEINISNVEEIDSSVFTNNNNLTEIEFSDKLTKISEYAFSGCTSLNTLNLPDSVEVILKEAFAQTGIKEFKMPKNVKTLSRNVFKASKLEKIDLNNVESIEDSGLTYLNSLKEIIMDKVSCIGTTGLYMLPNIETLSLGENIEVLQETSIIALENLSKVEIKGTLKTLGLHVFSRCPKLTEIITDDMKSGKKCVSRKDNEINTIIPIKAKIRKYTKRKTT